MTTVSRVAENLDGHGYGCKIEVPSAHPSVIAAGVPWRGSAAEYKRRLLLADRTMLLLALSRDTGSGYVVSDGQKWPRVHYSLNSVDKGHIMIALGHAARILVAAGAQEIYWNDPQLPPYYTTALGCDDPAFEAWLEKLADGREPHGLFSAHQMGTCRMAASPKMGAAKPSGELWEVRNLFVSDTSTFPTPSGSNPMVTCAAVAEIVAAEVVSRLALEAPRAKL